MGIRLGDRVRVLNARGETVEGEFILAWPLKRGGHSIKLRLDTGRTHYLTTTSTIEVLDRRALFG